MRNKDAMPITKSKKKSPGSSRRTGIMERGHRLEHRPRPRRGEKAYTNEQSALRCEKETPELVHLHFFYIGNVFIFCI